LPGWHTFSDALSVRPISDVVSRDQPSSAWTATGEMLCVCLLRINRNKNAKHYII